MFGAAGETFEEVGDEFGLEVADEGDVDLVVDGVGGAAGEVDGGDGEGLVHGHDEVAGAEDAALVAEGLEDGLAEGDAGVFDGVVLVDVEVALDGEGEIEAAVAGKELEHVIEEADAGGDLLGALAVKVEGESDFGFGGVAGDGGGGVPRSMVFGDLGRCWESRVSPCIMGNRKACLIEM